MLSQLQDQLTSIYRVNPGYDVMDFLITDPRIAGVLANGSLIPDTEETVLLTEDKHGLALSVFLDDAMLARLHDGNPLLDLRAHHLNDLWTVVEGISHFNYIAWRASRDHRVSLLELEMQAEIDKFVSTFFLAQSQEDSELIVKLHGWLFDSVSFNPALDAEQQERYQTANKLAARFCYGIRKRLSRDCRDGLDELRYFYRLSQRDKISHINAQSYAH